MSGIFYLDPSSDPVWRVCYWHVTRSWKSWLCLRRGVAEKRGVDSITRYGPSGSPSDARPVSRIFLQRINCSYISNACEFQLGNHFIWRVILPLRNVDVERMAKGKKTIVAGFFVRLKLNGECPFGCKSNGWS